MVTSLSTQKTLLQHSSSGQFQDGIRNICTEIEFFFVHLGILLEKMHSLYDDILSVFNGTVFGCVGRCFLLDSGIISCNRD